MSNGFQRVLSHIRSIAGTEAEKGRLFERLMKAYFRQDPLYGDRFSDVWLWSEWQQRRPEFGPDIGIDLVAEERDGGYRADQRGDRGRRRKPSLSVLRARGPRRAPVTFARPSRAAPPRDGYDQRQRDILDLLKHSDQPLALREIWARLPASVSVRQVTRALARLRELGLVATTGHGVSARWKPGPEQWTP